MLRPILLSLAIFLLVVGALFAGLGFFNLADHSNEWRTISKTGFPFDPSEFTWSDWQPIDATIVPMGFVPTEKFASDFAYHIGSARGHFFDFTAYRGRYTQDGVVHYYPATGPEWGAAYHWIWSLVSLALGGASFLAWFLLYPVAKQRES